MDRNILLVGLGGFIGSILRYFVSVLAATQISSAFPFGTIIVNVAGCFLIGVIFALSEKGNVLTPEWRVFLTTGFCGGFTTFSTFSYESMRLLQDGQFLFLALNLTLSVAVGFAATYLGMFVIKIL
ncbi:MAG TPA: fluoride efflux transporter CrcB [Pyrinomonadaceae bacterium]|jgi:CrcB protein|nr:fluoride efflux transporter CrcB [Pyrinomonadaceae bacterium]